jgi:hypothetical protein
LPESVREKLMIKYIFIDIFENFSYFFKSSQDKKIHQKFIYELSKGFLPRNFNPFSDKSDEYIYDEEDDVPEMYFCIEG